MVPDTEVVSRFKVPATLDAIGAIQAAVEEAAEGVLAPAAVFKLTMSIEELVTNIVTYGKAEGTDIGVVITATTASLSVELDDAGVAFDPFHQAPEPRLNESVEDRAIGGLGVFLVREMVDEVAYHRSAERNHIRLVMLRPTAKSDGTAP
ncbi:ATP-binding protein [Oryzicola mucosus]|uniref:ATP-binding protein n=1 Tax=Oryzicola mucosus TaxID=2767425 RepID=A0A8J6PVC2_9HYPH|nr:ATP-binding protein [Oryzicola mucosus]MBD0415471.1 ATP-binding protein [Oryzicola mucosus]